jgi:hypothetical protein
VGPCFCKPSLPPTHSSVCGATGWPQRSTVCLVAALSAVTLGCLCSWDPSHVTGSAQKIERAIRAALHSHVHRTTAQHYAITTAPADAETHSAQRQANASDRWSSTFFRRVRSYTDGSYEPTIPKKVMAEDALKKRSWQKTQQPAKSRLGMQHINVLHAET